MLISKATDATFENFLMGLTRRYLGVTTLGPSGTLILCVEGGVLPELQRHSHSVPVVTWCPGAEREPAAYKEEGLLVAGSAHWVAAAVARLRPASQSWRWHSTMLLAVRAPPHPQNGT